MKKTVIFAILLITGTVFATKGPFPPWLEKISGDLSIDHNGVATMAATLTSLDFAEDESITNAVDDTLEAKSNDAAMVFRIEAVEGYDATLSLASDDGDDSSDVYSFVSGDTNGLTIKNGSTSLATLGTGGDWAFLGTTPYLTIGDAGAEDAGIIFDGHSGGVDWHISSDDSADDLVIGLGSAPDTTNRLVFDGAGEKMTLGAGAGDVDTIVVYDGTAQNFQIGLDDSTDDLTIGLGVLPGTTDAIRIDENQDVTFVQNVLGLGTDSLSGFLQKSVASTSVLITAAQCGSTFVSNSADVMQLPEASTVLGCRVTFVCGTADDFDINPQDSPDIIGPVSTTNGSTAVVTLAPSAGDAIRCTDVGGSITLQAITADIWAQVGGGNGIWTDVN